METALHQHEAVLHVAVVAAEDEFWGEVPVAVVEVKPGAQVRGDDRSTSRNSFGAKIEITGVNNTESRGVFSSKPRCVACSSYVLFVFVFVSIFLFCFCFYISFLFWSLCVSVFLFCFCFCFVSLFVVSLTMFPEAHDGTSLSLS